MAIQYGYSWRPVISERTLVPGGDVTAFYNAMKAVFGDPALTNMRWTLISASHLTLLRAMQAANAAETAYKTLADAVEKYETVKVDVAS